jgi:hypothetical protein
MGDQATEYEIIAYSPEFRDRLLLLQRRSWGPDLAGNSNYFKWKYEDNPHGDQPLVYLALFDGEVVGMRGFWDTTAFPPFAPATWSSPTSMRTRACSAKS